TIGQALAIPEQGTRLVQAVLRQENSGLHFEVYSSADDDTWKQHAAGSMVVADIVTALPNLATARAACTEERDVARVYERFDALGMRYGSAFRGLTQIWHGSDAALG